MRTPEGGTKYKCPECGQKMRVLEVRLSEYGARYAYRRRRECVVCGHKITTYEHEH